VFANPEDFAMSYLIRLVLVVLALCAGAAQAASDRHLVFVSDLHVGAGRLHDGRWNPIEDFRWQDDFDHFLQMVSERSGKKADLILAGDVFELWQSPTMSCSADIDHPGCKITDCNDADTEIGCSEKQALARLATVLAQHPLFIASLKRFASDGDNRVVLIPGNHDGALTFPALQAELLRRFAPARVSIAAAGYWLSPDGAVYSDHGHQFDDVNRFENWPKPFVKQGGQRYIVKPWGENMVQRFYNQYEAVFPIVDNLSDEKAGVRYAVHQAGFPDSQAAVRRFLRFFLYEESLRQAMRALGKPGAAGWDLATVAKKPAAFFLDVLPPEERPAAGQADLVPSKLDKHELETICAAKDQMENTVKCPRPKQKLGAAAKGVLFSEEQRQRAYLLDVLPQVAAGGALANVYVYGHTHRAVPPQPLALGEVGHGTAEVTVVNTGAFQRVASAAQIERILRQPRNAGKRALDLVPEDLPACYTYVWIEPYSGRDPSPRLFRWLDNGEGYQALEGSCLEN
jgi:UDP-2,3-diacylglucosamine pyrophosphatase LpxH